MTGVVTSHPIADSLVRFEMSHQGRYLAKYGFRRFRIVWNAWDRFWQKPSVQQERSDKERSRNCD